jgi:1,2-phenylacetyl-CoA epoxidase catalytic subunit
MAQVTEGIQAFTVLLESIADNKYVLGDQLVDIGMGAPTIEAATSAIAMAQGELGHARVLYNWVFDLRGGTGQKPEIRGQTGKAFQFVMNCNDWISLIAALYAVDVAQDLVLRNILEQRRSDVATRIHKLIKEQKEHILYSYGWAVSMLNDQGSIPTRFRNALEKNIPETVKWLEEVEKNSALVAEGFISKDAEFAKKFQDTIAELLGKKGTVAV